MKQVLIAIGSLIFFQVSYANPGTDAWNAFLEGDFDKVDTILVNIEFDSSLGTQMLAEVLLAKSAVHAMLGEDSSAYFYMESSLQNHPDLERTAVELPPPVWKIFKSVKDKIVANRLIKETDNPVLNMKFNSEPLINDTLTDEDLTPEVETYQLDYSKLRRINTLKSLALPGWGHLAENRSSGYFFAAIDIVTIAGLIYFLTETNNHYDEYMSERDMQLISEKYNKYNTSRKIAIGFGISAALNFVVAQYDFLRVN